MVGTDRDGGATASTSGAASADGFTVPVTVTTVDPNQYDTQLQDKLQRVKALFHGFDLPPIDVYPSPKPQHYRMRAEFTVFHDYEAPEGSADRLYYVMFDTSSGKKPPPRIRVDQFPVATKLVNELMQVVREECLNSQVLRQKLFQVNFHTTLSGQAMVTLLYHRKLDETWTEAANVLRKKLAAAPSCQAGHVPSIIGRSRKQKLELDGSFVIESLNVNGKVYLQKQVEGAFSQPNGAVCQEMLSWAQEVTRGSHDHDLLELYCGNGNFTVPLAENFRRVVATEVSKTSVDAARYNMEVNGVTNTFLARMASEEFAETMRERGTRRRLEGLGSWEDLRLHTILVDPPRAGLDAFTVELLQGFERIVYISCNPETLHDNLRVISKTHRIERFAVFDQFPYTHHLECGVYLVKREQAQVAAAPSPSEQQEQQQEPDAEGQA